MSAIIAEGLTKRFGDRVALDQLTLRVEAGETFGFLGPNGAGKSTTIRLLLDLIRPTVGHVEVLGFDCHEQSLEVRKRVGYLAGELRLFPSLTGIEHAHLIARMRGFPQPGPRIAELGKRLELELERKVKAYSKGNRQKLGLLLALLDEPPILLLDEPTSGLDPIMQHVVWQILREEAQRGATVFFSSHVMAEVEEVCERVGILRTGQLVAVESVSGMRARAPRHVEVDFAREAPAAEAFQLPGVREVRRERSTLEFELRANIGTLLKALVVFEITDLRTSQPTLEELLLGYYEGTAS